MTWGIQLTLEFPEIFLPQENFPAILQAAEGKTVCPDSSSVSYLWIRAVKCRRHFLGNSQSVHTTRFNQGNSSSCPILQEVYSPKGLGMPPEKTHHCCGAKYRWQMLWGWKHPCAAPALPGDPWPAELGSQTVPGLLQTVGHWHCSQHRVPGSSPCKVPWWII